MVLFSTKSTVDLLIIAVVIGKKAILTFRFMWVQVVTGTNCEHKENLTTVATDQRAMSVHKPWSSLVNEALKGKGALTRIFTCS